MLVFENHEQAEDIPLKKERKKRNLITLSPLGNRGNNDEGQDEKR